MAQSTKSIEKLKNIIMGPYCGEKINVNETLYQQLKEIIPRKYEKKLADLYAKPFSFGRGKSN